MVEKIRRHSRILDRAGFTLIEIMIAVLILSSSLVVLLGLLSSVTERFVRDRNMTQAILLARSILAHLEYVADSMEDQNINSPATEILTNYNLLDAPDRVNAENIKHFQVSIQSQKWGIPDYAEAMRRITLTVNWSDSPLDRLVCNYFAPLETKEIEDDN